MPVTQKRRKYVHAKCDQEGGAGESQIAEELERREWFAKRSLSNHCALKRMLTSWQVSTALGEMMGQRMVMG
jgi:primosomal protein N''